MLAGAVADIRAEQWKLMLAGQDRWAAFCRAANDWQHHMAQARSALDTSLTSGFAHKVGKARGKGRRKAATETAAADPLPVGDEATAPAAEMVSDETTVVSAAATPLALPPPEHARGKARRKAAPESAAAAPLPVGDEAAAPAAEVMSAEAEVVSAAAALPALPPPERCELPPAIAWVDTRVWRALERFYNFPPDVIAAVLGALSHHFGEAGALRLADEEWLSELSDR